MARSLLSLVGALIARTRNSGTSSFSKMKVVCWTSVAFLSLTISSVVEAQLPGLPTSWQSGTGYFVGPFGPASTNPANAVYCTDLQYALQYGYPAVSFFASISSRDATPSGYTYGGLGGQCMSPAQPNVFSSFLTPNASAIGFDPGAGNLLDNPAGQPSSLGPLPNVAALRILPQAPSQSNNPPVAPPTPPVLDPHVAPEPETWLLLGTGLLAVAGLAALKGTRL